VLQTGTILMVLQSGTILMVLQSGTILCLPLLICRLKIRY
jgi:hypothetical protein